MSPEMFLVSVSEPLSSGVAAGPLGPPCPTEGALGCVPAPVPARQTALSWKSAGKGREEWLLASVLPRVPRGRAGVCPPLRGQACSVVSLFAAFPAVLDKGLPVSVPAEQTQALAESLVGCYGSWRRREANRGALLAPFGLFLGCFPCSALVCRFPARLGAFSSRGGRGEMRAGGSSGRAVKGAGLRAMG